MLSQMPIREGSKVSEVAVRQLPMLSQVRLRHFLMLSQMRPRNLGASLRCGHTTHSLPREYERFAV